MQIKVLFVHVFLYKQEQLATEACGKEKSLLNCADSQLDRRPSSFSRPAPWYSSLESKILFYNFVRHLQIPLHLRLTPPFSPQLLAQFSSSSPLGRPQVRRWSQVPHQVRA